MQRGKGHAKSTDDKCPRTPPSGRERCHGNPNHNPDRNTGGSANWPGIYASERPGVGGYAPPPLCGPAYVSGRPSPYG